MATCRHGHESRADIRVVGGTVVQISRRPPECGLLAKASDRGNIAARMIAAGAGATTTSCGFAEQRKCPWYESR
jgi:hypothetical protein